MVRPHFTLGRHSYNLLKNRNNWRLGYEAELAMGQSLNTLMFHGYHVFHSVPMGGYDIDHVVIGPSGVYDVETKGRGKIRKTGKDGECWKVVYDDKGLHLPYRDEVKPITQAKNNSESLRKLLKKKTGIDVSVSPVLSLPGWFISFKSKPEIIMCNAKNPTCWAVKNKPTLLNQPQIDQIVDVLDDLCRDVTAFSFKEAPETNDWPTARH